MIAPAILEPRVQHLPAGVKVRLARPRQLSAGERDLWRRLQQADPDLGSPFLALELIETVAAVRSDVEVAVLERDGETLGFLPFQRGRGDIGRPVLDRISEFQGMVAPRGLAFDAADLLRQCGLVAWHFGHLVASQQPFQPYHWVRSPSPYMDLSHGYEAYQAAGRRAGSAVLTEVARKARRCARQVGPLRFELHSHDDQAFRSLIEWKSRQHARTNRLEVLRTPWLRELLERLRGIETPQFAGPLSALYAGDELLAVHLGLASPASLHVWFPAYNLEHARHSPGLILLVEMARAAAARGIRRIDFGKGPERYKSELMNGAAMVAEGALDTRPVQRLARFAWHGAKQWVRSSPQRAVLARPLEWSRRWRQRRAFGQ
jgi:CelD/BcsL family acetyltransferase involved in cellulose biosynthesis